MVGHLSLKRKAISSLTSESSKKPNVVDLTGTADHPIASDDDQDAGENRERFNGATLVVQRCQKVTIAQPQRNFDFILDLQRAPGRRCML